MLRSIKDTMVRTWDRFVNKGGSQPLLPAGTNPSAGSVNRDAAESTAGHSKITIGTILFFTILGQLIRMFSIAGSMVTYVDDVNNVFGPTDSSGNNIPNGYDEPGESGPDFLDSTSAAKWSFSLALAVLFAASLAYSKLVITRNHLALSNSEPHRDINPLTRGLQIITLPSAFAGSTLCISGQLRNAMLSGANIDPSLVLSIHSGFVLLGVLGSIAPTMTHYHAMRIANGEVSGDSMGSGHFGHSHGHGAPSHHSHSHGGDCEEEIESKPRCTPICTINALGNLGDFVTFVGIVSYIADIFSYSKNDPIFLEYTAFDLSIGLAIAIALKALAVVAHRHIYKNHTDGSVTQHEINAASAVTMTRSQLLACGGHALADTMDGAGEFKVAINAALPNPSLSVRIGLDVFAFFAGAPTAIGEWLTVQRSTQITNMRAANRPSSPT